MSSEPRNVSHDFPEIFHYTSLSAFHNIVASNELWATHYCHLNDSSEFSRFREVLRPFISEILEPILDNLTKEHRPAIDSVHASQLDQEIDQWLGRLHRSILSEVGIPEIFIFSFCAHETLNPYVAKNGLLSQWRAYGSSNGVAIVFDTLAVERLMEMERALYSHTINHIGDVKYDDDVSSIRKEFSNVFEFLPDLLKSHYEGGRPAFEMMFEHFLYGCTLVKHHAFREEREIRIVVAPLPTSPVSVFFDGSHDDTLIKKVLWRRRDESKIKYIKLFGFRPLPIKRVIVGPSRTQDANFLEVSRSVESMQIEVIRSETPYLP